MLAGGGHPLGGPLRATMEQRFGADLGDVRLHTDAAGARAARSLGAKAFTRGHQIGFAAGRFAPGTTEGNRLLSHEIAHVVQQTRRGGASGDPHAAELEAKAAGTKGQHTAPAPIAVQQSAPIGIQRDRDDGPQEQGFFARTYSRAKARVSREAHELAAEGKAAVGAVEDRAIQELTEVRQGIAATEEKVLALGREAKAVAKDTIAEARAEVSTAATSVANEVMEVKQAATQQLQKAKAVVAKYAPKVVEKVKHEASDAVLESAGKIKGVILEGTTLIDSVVWLGYETADLSHKAVDKATGYARNKGLISAENQKLAVAAFDLVSGAGAYRSLTDSGLVHTEDGVPNLSGYVSEKLDKVAHKLEDKLDPTPHSEDLIFSSYEKGELEGAIGTQVALAFVGAEEVQLVLKVLGAIGGVKGIVQTIQKNPAWKTDPAFWSGLLNLALSVVGLNKAAAGKKIIQIALKAQAFVSAIPAVLNLYHVATDPALAKDPEKQHKEIAAAARGLIFALKDIVLTIVHSGKANTPEKSAPNETPSTGKPAAPASETPLGAANEPPTRTPVTAPSPSETVTPQRPVVERPSAAPPATKLTEVAPPAAPVSPPVAPSAPQGAEVVPIQRGAKPVTERPKLRPGTRPVSDLAEARARRQAATRPAPTDEPAQNALPVVQEQLEVQAEQYKLAAGAEDFPLTGKPVTAAANDVSVIKNSLDKPGSALPGPNVVQPTVNASSTGGSGKLVPLSPKTTAPPSEAAQPKPLAPVSEPLAAEAVAPKSTPVVKAPTQAPTVAEPLQQPVATEIRGEPVRIPPKPTQPLYGPDGTPIGARPGRARSNLVDPSGRRLSPPKNQPFEVVDPLQRRVLPRPRPAPVQLFDESGRPLEPTRPSRAKQPARSTPEPAPSPAPEIISPAAAAAEKRTQSGRPPGELLEPGGHQVVPGARVALEPPLKLSGPIPAGDIPRGNFIEPHVIDQRYPGSRKLAPGHEGFDTVVNGQEQKVLAAPEKGPARAVNRIEGGQAVSIKSIDVGAKGYQSAEGVLDGLKRVRQRRSGNTRGIKEAR